MWGGGEEEVISNILDIGYQRNNERGLMLIQCYYIVGQYTYEKNYWGLNGPNKPRSLLCQSFEFMESDKGVKQMGSILGPLLLIGAIFYGDSFAPEGSKIGPRSSIN